MMPEGQRRARALGCPRTRPCMCSIPCLKTHCVACAHARALSQGAGACPLSALACKVHLSPDAQVRCARPAWHVVRTRSLRKWQRVIPRCRQAVATGVRADDVARPRRTMSKGDLPSKCCEAAGSCVHSVVWAASRARAPLSDRPPLPARAHTMPTNLQQ